jgi:alpha-mannosidase
MVREIEYLATLASLKSKSYKYPKKDIDDMWENVLLCQFHDCLPGSSIEMCYDDSDALYAANAKLGRKVKEEALAVLGLSGHLRSSTELAAINTLPWSRSELVEIPHAQANSRQSHYTLAAGGPGVIKTQAAPSLASSVSVKEVKKGVFQLANRHFKVEIESGVITSLIDLRANREVIAKCGKANQLVLFDDKPLYWQAWDVEVFHLNSRKELKSGASEIVENGPYRVSVMTKTQVSDKSWVKTTISLDARDSDEPSYVAVEAEVEWQETMKFLKVEFPVDVTNTEASYEAQYGLVKRPTHYNTR